MRCLVLASIVCAVAFLTGCQAHSNVKIDVASNGSGNVEVEVRLDGEAARSVPNLADQLRTSDLADAGWSVDGPDRADNGDTVIAVDHGFDSPAEANALMRQLGGPFVDFRIEQEKSWSEVATRFTGNVDLSSGIESFGDDTLLQRTGARLGFDAAELQSSLGFDLAATFPLTVTIDLPGGDPDDSLSPRYGEVTPLLTYTSARNSEALIYLSFAALSLGAALLVSILWKSGKYRPQHRKKLGGGVRAKDLLNNG